ncbi:MAG TPA: hypothetical protein VMB25_12510 [Bryobacteraceae bacterium]|nr:hypothetical protein [Bryobacteraceae bacterium]
MRNLAILLFAVFSLISVGCVDGGVMLQAPLQGEWSNFHNDKNMISKDARQQPQNPPAEK